MLLVSDNPVGFGKLFDAPVLVLAHKEFGVHWIWQWQILTLWSFSIPSKTIYFELCTIWNLNLKLYIFLKNWKKKLSHTTPSTSRIAEFNVRFQQPNNISYRWAAPPTHNRDLLSNKCIHNRHILDLWSKCISLQSEMGGVFFLVSHRLHVKVNTQHKKYKTFKHIHRTPITHTMADFSQNI
jgi:hypothetical protein